MPLIPVLRSTEASGSLEFQASLVYIVSYRPSRLHNETLLKNLDRLLQYQIYFV